MKNVKIFTNVVEQEAIDQINTLANLPVFDGCKIRIMPDVHAGAGCVIGFTANLGDKVIPNLVGVDIGCGMLTVKLNEKDISFPALDDTIRKYIPCGMNVHEGRIAKFPKLQEMYCYRNLKDSRRIERSIGTLGGGNHFIEVDKDNEGNYYLITHSGSRNLGKQVANYYQNLAVELMQGKDALLQKQEDLIIEYKATGRKSEIQSAIKELHRLYNPNSLNISKDLCYLTGKYREEYLHDMKICQEYAVLNRKTMADRIIEKMNFDENSRFETIHNYIDHDTNIIRKGAISAQDGELLLIPINMRDGCIIGKGKGNEDWNCSAPHGAGRLMSRTKARETLNLDDFKSTMSDIFTTSVSSETIDEAPMAYKNIEDIVNNISDSVDIIEIIKPVYNFKAGE